MRPPFSNVQYPEKTSSDKCKPRTALLTPPCCIMRSLSTCVVRKTKVADARHLASHTGCQQSPGARSAAAPRAAPTCVRCVAAAPRGRRCPGAPRNRRNRRGAADRTRCTSVPNTCSWLAAKSPQLPSDDEKMCSRKPTIAHRRAFGPRSRSTRAWSNSARTFFIASAVSACGTSASLRLASTEHPRRGRGVAATHLHGISTL